MIFSVSKGKDTLLPLTASLPQCIANKNHLFLPDFFKTYVGKLYAFLIFPGLLISSFFAFWNSDRTMHQ